MERDDGGPAFPVMPPVDADGRSPSGYPFPDPGMTLRDYFAAAALQGMCFGVVGLIGGKEPVSAYAKGPCNAAMVDRAYALADAMLAARKKEPGA